MPIYKDIVKHVEDNIISGAYPKGALLPTEQDFCAMFSTSRMTVRKALDELAADGLIYRIKGKGSFVSQFDVAREYSLKGFSQMMAAQGVERSTKVLRTEATAADERVAKGLHIRPGDPVYYLERAQYIYNEAISIESLYFSAVLLPGLLEHDFTKESIYQTLADRYGKKIVRVQQKISTLEVKGEHARILFGKSSGIALYVRGAGYDINAVPIEYGRTFINGSKYSVDVLIQ